MKSSTSIEQALAELPRLDVSALRSAYRRLYGTAATRDASQLLLRQAVANRLHQQLLGRLRAKVQQVLNASEAITSMLIADSREMEFVCEWKGRIYIATPVETGVLFNGRHFRSLSAVARAITGRKISGRELFRIGTCAETSDTVRQEQP